jgi:hypothetical protein
MINNKSSMRLIGYEVNSMMHHNNSIGIETIIDMMLLLLLKTKIKRNIDAHLSMISNTTPSRYLYGRLPDVNDFEL